MKRDFPRFLYANPQDTKSKGPFIIHTLHPQFIAKLSFTDDGFHQLETLDVFAYADKEAVSNVIGQMHSWYTYQRMKAARLSDDYYDRANNIFQKLLGLKFFTNCGIAMVHKPEMGADLFIEIGNNKTTVGMANEDSFTMVYSKLKETYRRQYDDFQKWPMEL